MLLQLLANGLVSGCPYSFIALGFALIYNTTRIFHVSHGAVYTFSSYILYLFLIILRVPLLPSVFICLLLIPFMGIAIELLIYAPLERKGGSLLVALLSSLGFYIIVVNFIAMIFGNETKILRPAIEKTFTFGSVILTRIQVAQVLAFIILVPVVLLLLKKTNWGKSIRAIRDNSTLAVVMGINQRMIRISVFALGSALAALAAMLQALDVGMDPHVGMPALLTGAGAMIIGGVQVFEGAVVGAFCLGIMQGLIIWKISARWVDAITFVIFILFLVFKSEGLLGKRKRIEETLS